MKGVIVIALKELVESKFGKDKWQEALEKAGVNKNLTILTITDVDDQTVMKVVQSVCAVLNISLQQAADAFGEYWVCTYAQRMYSDYFKECKNAKDFILKMDQIHVITTMTMANAHPPRFDYEWKNDKTLIMKYKSSRGMIDFMIGLLKGIGKQFREDLVVTKLGPDKAEIIFSYSCK